MQYSNLNFNLYKWHILVHSYTARNVQVISIHAPTKQKRLQYEQGAVVLMGCSGSGSVVNKSHGWTA